MSTVLSVNLNKFALVRNSRGHNFPNIVSIAERVIKAGAGGITIHPRPDQRHAKYSDISALKEVTQRLPGTELNIEGFPTERFITEVINARPHQCTLVPDAPDQLTSDHGWDLTLRKSEVIPVIQRLKAAGIRVSLFIDPVPNQITLAAETGTDRVELYTESYARAFASEGSNTAPVEYVRAAEAAQLCKLGLNAGHDLSLKNLGFFLRHVPGIQEVSIGHALVVESWDFTIEETIKKYCHVIKFAAVR